MADERFTMPPWNRKSGKSRTPSTTPSYLQAVLCFPLILLTSTTDLYHLCLLKQYRRHRERGQKERPQLKRAHRNSRAIVVPRRLSRAAKIIGIHASNGHNSLFFNQLSKAGHFAFEHLWLRWYVAFGKYLTVVVVAVPLARGGLVAVQQHLVLAAHGPVCVFTDLYENLWDLIGPLWIESP